MNRQLSQQEIDAVFEHSQEGGSDPSKSVAAATFDFRRPDRISKSQLRAIHLLHENFVRSLVSDLSAYLRTYIIMNLVSVEQISYSEFLEGLPPSTFMACLGLQPYEGNAVLEINPSLVFPILEMLLGGGGRSYTAIQREVTEIEQNLMDGLLRIIMRDLADAWRSVSTIDFSVQTLDTEPQFLQVMAPTEAVVAIGIEMRIGDSSGLMNIAMPSLMIKMMRQKFDQQWSLRKTASTREEQDRILALLGSAYVRLDARINGATIRLGDLLQLKPGEVLALDYPIERPLECALNGQRHFTAEVVRSGSKRFIRIVDIKPQPASVGTHEVPEKLN